MENLLKQIVNNTEPKRSFSIVVSDDKTRFKTWFNHIKLDEKKDCEIALINLETYYSFPNIDSWILDPTIVLLIHLTLTHNVLTVLFLKAVITLKISMSSFNEK